MPDQNQQPMVRVKKADGSFVMVKLSDLKKSKLQPPPKKVWTREDTSSLLEEKLGLKNDAGVSPVTSQKRESDVNQVLSKMDFKIAQEFTNRLRSVIQLRLKDLRNDEETKETALRATKDGGLGLAPEQAEKLLKACHDFEAREMPATDVPFNPFVHKPTVKPAAPANVLPVSTPKKEEVINKFVQEAKKSEPFKLGTGQPVIKPFVRDITAPPVEMGPVEDLKYMTVIDFRRMSDKPAESAKRLKQKLLNLQDESFLLYMNGVEAYHNSPLYLDYINAISDSLANRRTLAATLGDKSRIQLAEVEALIEMEKEL